MSFNENLSGEFKFFSDRSIHSDPHAVNPIWAYILLPVSCVAMLFGFILISGSRDRVGNHLIFAPPLAFYLANVNPEVFGHFFVIGAYFVMRTRPRLALLLTVVATAIDRSHVCSMFMLMLIYFFAAARTWVFVCVVGGVLLMYLVRMMGLLDILDLLALVFDSVSVLGITGKDILFNAEFGGRGYAALFASVAGLYGAMSYRPVLWFLYYALFFGLFFLGYALSDHRERRVFWLCATAVLSIMILLPPLSQARFYPILILSMWSMAVRGGRWFGIPALQLQILFFSWTMFTLVLANLNRIAES